MKDERLIDQLRDRMRAHTDRTEVPAGFADRARRTARRRSARRAAVAGTPLLAAAAVATVLATGAGTGGSSPIAAPPPTVTVGGGLAHDTAYIVKRVKSRVADSEGGTVIHDYVYAAGDVSSDGSVVMFGQRLSDRYLYAAPDGTRYTHGASYNHDGGVYLTQFSVTVPAGNGNDRETATIINPANHTYSRRHFPTSDAETGPPTPNLYSSPAAVQQALQGDQVTQKGVVMLNGTRAIALSIALPSSDQEDLTLYVRAQTYQPLRTVLTLDGHPDLLVDDWIAATPHNIAQAKDDSIPAGYTKVARAYR